MNYRQSVNIAAVFLLLIFGFAIATVLKPSNERSETENRLLEQKPDLTWNALISGKFSEDYEAYLSDQFVVRDGWISLKTAFERAAFRQEAEDVYFARDNYLIEKHTGVFTAETAERNIQTLSAFFTNLSKSMDPAHLTAMVVPNAVDILRDKLPPFADPYDEEIYLQKIAGALPEGVWFDSSSVLRQHSGEELYYRTDHHWKTLSAYYTFEAWAGEKGLAGDSAFSFRPVTVTDSFEGTIASRLGIVGRADSIERFDPEIPFDYYLIYNQSDDIRNTVYQDSFLERKDKYAYFYGGNFGLIQAKMPEHETGRKLLVIKDSYAHCFVPFTYALFDQVDMLDTRYYNASISALIGQENYTDILFLFNAAGFAEETSLARLMS